MTEATSSKPTRVSCKTKLLHSLISWHVPLYVTTRGLSTSPIPHGARTFEIAFDFLDHRLLIRTSAGREAALQLRPQAVAAFYQELLGTLDELGVGVTIHGSPNEVEDATPFVDDWEHNSYDSEYVTRFWRTLVQSDRVFHEFRSRFIGKCSPVHFFWGSFDLVYRAKLGGAVQLLSYTSPRRGARRPWSKRRKIGPYVIVKADLGLWS